MPLISKLFAKLIAIISLDSVYFSPLPFGLLFDKLLSFH